MRAGRRSIDERQHDAREAPLDADGHRRRRRVGGQPEVDLALPDAPLRQLDRSDRVAPRGHGDPVETLLLQLLGYDQHRVEAAVAPDLELPRAARRVAAQQQDRRGDVHHPGLVDPRLARLRLAAPARAAPGAQRQPGRRVALRAVAEVLAVLVAVRDQVELDRLVPPAEIAMGQCRRPVRRHREDRQTAEKALKPPTVGEDFVPRLGGGGS